MILFHGTSTSRSELIQQYGFKNPNLESEIADIACRYDVTTNELRNQLLSMGRIVTSRHDDGRIYFSSHFLHAASYASRAPEFLWESLWAIYVLRFPELGQDWNQSDEGHAWVLSQMQSDPPVVIHIEVSDDLLGEDAERLRSFFEYTPPESNSGGMEIGITRGSGLKIKGVTKSDFFIDAPLLRYLNGASQKEMIMQMSEDKWGRPFIYQSDKYWLWDEVKSQLNIERLQLLGLA